MTASPDSGGKTAYHHGDLRAALLDAGERLLAEQGPAGLSLRGIARACEVSATAPYRHFRDKDALLAALATRAFSGFESALRAAAEAESDPARRLRGLGKAYVAHALAHPHRLRLMFGAHKPPLVPEDEDSAALYAVAGEAFRHLERSVAAIVPGPAQKTREAVVAAWSLVHGFALLCLDLPNSGFASDAADRERLLDGILDTFYRGLRAEMER